MSRFAFESSGLLSASIAGEPRAESPARPGSSPDDLVEKIHFARLRLAAPATRSASPLALVNFARLRLAALA
jgi:hypothetical protein